MIWIILVIVGACMIFGADAEEALIAMGIILIVCGLLGGVTSVKDKPSKLVEDNHRLKKEIAEKMKKRNTWKWHQHLIKENQQLKDSLEKL